MRLQKHYGLGKRLSLSLGRACLCRLAVSSFVYISTNGIVPDFRSAKGLFKTLRAKHKLKASGKQLFDASVYADDSSTASFHDMVREMSEMTAAAQSTEFHHMLARLAKEDRLLRLYTQNVDALDTKLDPLATQVPLSRKGPWPKTIQLHGGLQKMVCSKCNYMDDFKPEKFDGSDPPACEECTKMDEVREIAQKRSHGL